MAPFLPFRKIGSFESGFDGSHSDPLHGRSSGLPSVPDPLSGFIQDLLQNLKEINRAHPQGFPNNTVVWWICSRGESDRNLVTQLERCLDDWACQWKMTFNASKCKIMSIGRIRNTHPSFHLNGTSVKCVSCLRYFGGMVGLQTLLETPHPKSCQKSSNTPWGNPMGR